jgi:UDP-4-amino-4,6-dideoxy-N-acetyl-beta-L-altrosamine transaminase
MTFIPYGQQWIDEEDIQAVEEVLRGDWITTGPKVDEFENKLASYVGAKHAVAVNSGTSALDIAVACLGLEPGSEVITTPFTFVASSNCLLYNGLKPVFVDIDPKTYNIDPEKIKGRITPKTKAILYVDYAGQPCKMKELREIAEEHGLSLIEDAAHAIGAEYQGKKVGSFADVTEFSFHPVKHITTGEGGAVTTNNDEYAEKLRMLRNHGMDKSVKERFGAKAGYSYDIQMLGRNYRITDFQCALGLSQMRKLEGFLKRREEIVKQYNDAFSKMDEITAPHVEPDVRHAWHLYTVLLDKNLDRDDFFARMRGKKIGVNVHYIPIYEFSYYREHFELNGKDYPVTGEVYSRILTLPLFSKMSGEHVKKVIDSVRQTIEEMKG